MSASLFLNGVHKVSNIFKGLAVDKYILEEEVGAGEIGVVYRAIKIGDIHNVRAIKLVINDKVKDGWQNEIIKVNRLERVPGVVSYYDHGIININETDFLWIMWQYIPGISLKKLISSNNVTIPLLLAVVEKILEVMHACNKEQIIHGDLHSGNIIIEELDTRRIDTLRPVWVTDFGYKASLGAGTLDDYDGLNRIIQDCIEIIDFHSLEGDDKQSYTVLKHEFPKYLLESNYTEGDYVKNPEKLIRLLRELCNIKKALISSGERNIQDYLAAELIGDQYDEWQKLFVPHFLGMDHLLGRNTSVLTGLRGCGKTMIFRRLTALFDLHLGESGIINSDTFLGFYLNARNIAEAFPWLPPNKKDEARRQVINYFHLCLTIEVTRWLKELYRRDHKFDVGWLLEFITIYYSDLIVPLTDTGFVISNLLTYLSAKLDKSRLTDCYHDKEWELSDYNYLEKLFTLINVNMKNYSRGVYYLYLDDYSTPLVKSVIQEILNPIIFKRSSIVIFKVSTESVESFIPLGLNDKSLEEGDDYVLIDFASESIQRDKKDRKEILSAILKPRIDRYKLFDKMNLSLEDVLGVSELNNDNMAALIKGTVEDKQKLKYYGYNVFCSTWSSNVREMISIFAAMVNTSNLDSIEQIKENINKHQCVIPHDDQDKILRTAGGNFLQLLSSATPVSSDNYEANEYRLSFGDHLVKIAKAFQEIATYEIKHKSAKNQGSSPPKHARRIEIKEIRDFPNEYIREYYKGIIRYGLFLRDNRGKSVRGKAIPRLVIRGLLIPYFTLTYSLRGNIMFSWDEFCNFLEHPDTFTKEYIKKQTDQLNKKAGAHIQEVLELQ